MKSISLQNVSFSYAGGADLLTDASCVFAVNKIVALVGDNGAGKTTLLKLIAGELLPDSGRVVRTASVYLMPQLNSHNGRSGGQTQMSVLSAAFASSADILLLDEPTNNLDRAARESFMSMLRNWPGGAVIVSHDRELLHAMDTIVELRDGRLTTFGGNYDFYIATKSAMQQTLESKYTDTQKRIAELNRTLNVAQNTRQHHEQKQQRERNSARRSPIAANALRGKSQETEAKARKNIQRKLNEQMELAQNLSEQMRDDTIKIPIPSKPFYSKDLVQISNMSFAYGEHAVFDGFNFTLYGGQKLRVVGDNGAGKTTLLKLIMGELKPQSGAIKTHGKIAYLNQDMTLLNPNKSVVENIMEISGALQHDAHAIAANFGFRGDASKRRAGILSGGELLRATLAAVLGGNNQPDLLILDEPTNNLDIKSTTILESALNQYRGAILVVSHDEAFVRNINTTETVGV